jgi:hypothetical protein
VCDKVWEDDPDAVSEEDEPEPTPAPVATFAAEPAKPKSAVPAPIKSKKQAAAGTAQRSMMSFFGKPK